MNQFLPSRYDENIQRLALGLEPVDAMRLRRVAQPLRVEVEYPPKASAKPPVQRHPSCLHALLYYPALVDSVDIRIFEHFDPLETEWQYHLPRQFVPRRFHIPLHTQGTVDTFPYTDRVRRPFMFPGAGYDLDSCATGIRGSVLRADTPMRWARVTAVLASSGHVVGRAHGDDRGEFLLLIDFNAIPVGDLVSPVTLQVNVFGPDPIPVAVPPDLPSRDPFWDLPLETPPAPGAADTVSTGETLPSNYTKTTGTNVDFFLGELRSAPAPFTIV
jgi:hypothetical protein